MNTSLLAFAWKTLALLAVGAVGYGIGFQSGLSSAPQQADVRDIDKMSGDVADESSGKPESRAAAAFAPPESPQLEADSGLSLRDEGYRSAGTDIEAALRKLETLRGRERSRFVRGIFENLADTQAPGTALELASLLIPQDRSVALKALVASWALDQATLSPDALRSQSSRIMRLSGNRLGLEVELASVLANSNADDSVKAAWVQGFGDHPGRSEIQARFAAASGDPSQIETALAQSEQWTAWEQDNFSESLVFQWARQDPQQAWSWYQENGDRIGGSHAGLILDTWANRNPSQLIASLAQIPESTQRQSAIESIAKSLARRETLQATEWADSLADPQEQSLAYAAIDRATPKGIGARVDSEAGFLRINEIMTGGALEGSELQAGDLIVEATEAGGSPVSLYGRSLREAIGELRGPPGSEVEIRTLRRNPNTGELEEKTTRVKRGLLIR